MFTFWNIMAFVLPPFVDFYIFLELHKQSLLVLCYVRLFIYSPPKLPTYEILVQLANPCTSSVCSLTKYGLLI